MSNIKEYLKCYEWEYLNQRNKDKIEIKIENIKQKINLNNLIDLKRKIKNLNKSEKFNKSTVRNIDPLISLDYLIRNNYLFEYDTKIQIKTSNLNFHKYRSISGDGNCFYRSIIFYFIENIIFTNNIMLLKELIILYDEKIYSNPFIKDDNDIKIENIRDNVIIGFMILLDFMEKDDSTAYNFLIKIFLYDDFDYGIIYFTRYLLYLYISSNEDKIYSKENDIEIGLLLPKDFVKKVGKNNQYLFKDYYKKHLLKMKIFAEKLDIYVVPFVFNCDLNIVNIKYSYINSKEIEFKENIQLLKCGKNNATEINLLYNDIHYEIIYKKDYYEKNSKLFDLFNYDNINDPKLKEKIRKYNFKLDLKPLESKKDVGFPKYLSDEKKLNSKHLIDEENNIICLNCLKPIQNSKFYKKFPCGCKICSSNCFDEYLNPRIEKSKKFNYRNDSMLYDHITYCRCGYVNNKNKIKEIINEKIENNNNEKYKKIIENHWKWKCMFMFGHNANFDRRFRYYRVIFKEKNPFTKRKLEHLVCFTCKNEKIDEKNKKIKCDYCDSEHEISKIIDVSEYNENESTCIII